MIESKKSPGKQTQDIVACKYFFLECNDTLKNPKKLCPIDYGVLQPYSPGCLGQGWYRATSKPLNFMAKRHTLTLSLVVEAK